MEQAQAQSQSNAVQTQRAGEQKETAMLRTKVQELYTQLAKKQSQLHTLNETSVHARESLLHFRDASNEQNAALLRQEEQHAQQVEQQLSAVLYHSSLGECW
jgi:hypothetical protein